MEKNQLKYVVTVAKYGSISKAADVLFISQPALSNQIIALEKELGIKLFERSKKRIYLTHAGSEFVSSATRILSEIDTLKSTMFDYANLNSGKLKIGLTSSMIPFGFGDFIGTYALANPTIDVSIIEDSSMNLISFLDNNTLDVAFVILVKPEDYDQLHTIKIFESKVCAIMSANNPLSKLKVLPITALADQKLILNTNNSTFQRIIVSLLEEHSINYNVFMVSTQISSCFTMVEKNFGIYFTSIDLRNYAGSPNIKALPLEPSITRSIYLVFKKNPEYHPVLKDFISRVTDHFSSITETDIQI